MILATSRLPFFNPELHAMAFCVLGDHAKAQSAVERALSAYALRHQDLVYGEHPWTLEINDLTEWVPRHRMELMEQLWEVLRREKSHDSVGFYALGVTERVALFLRARTSLELEDIARLLQLSNSDTVALLERARRDLLDRNAPGLLEEPQGYSCRHGLRAEALAALDVERFNDDFLVRHMRECQECTNRFSEARKRRDAWLAFIPEGKIPREVQRDFENRLPQILKEIMPQNLKSKRAIAARVGKGGLAAIVDLLRATARPTFILPVAAVVIITWLIYL